MSALSVSICGIQLRNPLVLASGIWGSCADTLVRAARAGAGAVTAKSCSLDPRAGHENPTVLPWRGGLINAVGLSNPGARTFQGELARAKQGMDDLGVPLIASVFGDTADAFANAVGIIAEAGADAIELNISCPNVESEFGRPFALDPQEASRVVEAVRSVHAGILFVKLSPNTPVLVDVARAVVESGADALTAVNTLGPGMIIDLSARRPVLTNLRGGVSGAALLPVAVRCVFDLAAAVDVPIIGTGGVSSGADALQMIMAGATAVGLGSAFYVHGEATFRTVLAEMQQIIAAESLGSLEEIQGCAHV